MNRRGDGSVQVGRSRAGRRAVGGPSDETAAATPSSIVRLFRFGRCVLRRRLSRDRRAKRRTSDGAEAAPGTPGKAGRRRRRRLRRRAERKREYRGTAARDLCVRRGTLRVQALPQS